MNLPNFIILFFGFFNGDVVTGRVLEQPVVITLLVAKPILNSAGQFFRFADS